MLRLLIPPTWPRENAACDWALLDDSGRLLQSGYSDPRTWPAAESCELVLTAEQCVCLTAEVPTKARNLKDEVIVGALEDQLLGDIDDEHWVVGRADGAGKTPVWLVRRQRVADILETLRQLGRKPLRLVWEVQLLPWRTGRWSVAVSAKRGLARRDADSGWAFDVSGDAPPIELLLALEEAGRLDRRPAGLELLAGAPVGLDLARWQRELGIPCEASEPWDWRTMSLVKATNFLIGDFAPRGGNQFYRRYLPAAWILGAALGIHVLALTGEWLWLDQRAGSLRAEILMRYQQSFPGSRAILDPYAQMHMDAGRLANTRGELGSADFLALLTAASADITPEAGSVSRLKYENRQLRIEFASAPANVDGIVLRLQQKGLSAQMIASESGVATLVVGGAQ